MCTNMKTPKADYWYEKPFLPKFSSFFAKAIDSKFLI
jgi:hypothetical protein